MMPRMLLRMYLLDISTNTAVIIKTEVSTRPDFMNGGVATHA